MMVSLSTLNQELNARVQELVHVMEQILQAERAEDWGSFETLADLMSVKQDQMYAAMRSLAAFPTTDGATPPIQFPSPRD